MADPLHPKKEDNASDGVINQTPNDLSSEQPPTSGAVTRRAAPWRGWDAITWATVVNSALTLMALMVAIFLGVYSLWATSENLRQSNMATIYAFGFEITKFQEEHPKLAKFFDKGLRGP